MAIDFSKTSLIAIDTFGNKIDATKKYSKLVKMNIEDEQILGKINNGTILGTESWKLPSFVYKRDVKRFLVERAANAKGKLSKVAAPVVSTYDTQITNNINIFDFHEAVDNFDIFASSASEEFASAMIKFDNNIKEKVASDLIEDSVSKTASYKVYTYNDKTNSYTTATQPAQAANTTAGAIASIKAGRRSVVATDIDADKKNRYELLLASIIKMSKLGTKTDANKDYPFAKGFSKDKIKIITTLENATKIKDFINLSTDLNGGSIDLSVEKLMGVEIVTTALLPAEVEFIVLTTRAWDHSLQPIASQNTTKILYGGYVEGVGEVPETTARLKNQKAVSKIVLFPGEIITIKNK